MSEQSVEKDAIREAAARAVAEVADLYRRKCEAIPPLLLDHWERQTDDPAALMEIRRLRDMRLSTPPGQDPEA